MRQSNLVKRALFYPLVRDVIRSFPEEIKRSIGKAIYDLQKGEKLSMPLCRMISDVAMGVEELRVKDRSGVYRVFFYAKSAEGLLIFHAFKKKTQKTSQGEIELGRKRLREMLI